MHKFTSLKKNVADAVTSAVAGARDLAVEAKEGVERALVAKCLRNYSVKEQVATGGPTGLWKIHVADCRSQGSQYPRVAVWLLEKKMLQDSFKGTKTKVWDPFIEQQRKNAGNMLKLKHPGILKLLEPMEETRAQFIMVTEPVSGSLHNFLHGFEGVPNVPNDSESREMPELEIKHGLLQVADALHFLHTEANMAHCSVSPESIVIGSDGKWHLADLGLCTQIDYSGSRKSLAFDYSNSHPLIWESLTKPRLGYVAPELAGGHAQDLATNITPACDVFSLGLVAYEAIAKRPLLVVNHEIMTYKSKMASIAQADLSAVSQEFQYSLRMMLHASPSSRPPAAAFSSSPYFQEDKLIRALVFLDSIVQRDAVQKAAFFTDLDTFWPTLHNRIIRYKVLPNLLQELHNPSMQSLVIPFLFKAVTTQSKDEFKHMTLPKLKSILMNAKGEGMLTILKHIDELAKLMNRELIGITIFPVLIRALEEMNPRVVEEALKKIQSMVEDFDYEPLKGKLLPRVHVICLRTSSAKVRINSLVLLGNLAHRMDTDEAVKMLHTCAQVASVDKTPATLMCVLGVADAISKHWGPEITAQKVLPLICPLLVATGLSHQQFSMYITLVREMLKRVEDKRGGPIDTLPAAAAAAAAASPDSDNGKLENGWDSGPQQQGRWTGESQSQGTPSQPVAPSALFPSSTSDSFLPSDLGCPPISNPKPIPLLGPPVKAKNPSTDLAMFGDWQSTPKLSQATALGNSGPSIGLGQQLGGTPMNSGMDWGVTAGQTSLSGGTGLPPQPQSTSSMNSGLLGSNQGKVPLAGTGSFCDPNWKDPPLQPLSVPSPAPRGGGFQMASSTPSQDLMFAGLSIGQPPGSGGPLSGMQGSRGQAMRPGHQSTNAGQEMHSFQQGQRQHKPTAPIESLGIETSGGPKIANGQGGATGDPFLDLLS